MKSVAEEADNFNAASQPSSNFGTISSLLQIHLCLRKQSLLLALAALLTAAFLLQLMQWVSKPVQIQSQLMGYQKNS